jgi:hypothetical protein
VKESVKLGSKGKRCDVFNDLTALEQYPVATFSTG